MTKRIEYCLVGLIVILGIFFRFHDLRSVPPGLYPDEAMNGTNAQEANSTGEYKLFYPENNGREGLFINLQALSIKTFGNEPWALRLVSAIIGSLTILGIWLLAKELFIQSPTLWGYALSPSLVALVSSFFLATSYWHLNFSRIGFRAIMVPLLMSFGFYWLLKAFRTGYLSSAILGGLILGLGFHTYIAWRIVPALILIVFIIKIWEWKKSAPEARTACSPCTAAIVSFFILLATLPMIWYFLGNQQDLSGRQNQVSIFAAENPPFELAKSVILELGMFNVRGDCNGRHNFNCSPELHWLVGIFFLAGFLLMLSELIGNRRNGSFSSWFLFFAFFIMMAPAALTREGMPHALRSIGMIVSTMIIAAMGAAWLWSWVSSTLEKKLTDPKYAADQTRILRIRKELMALAALGVILIALNTYHQYFNRFADHKETYFAFASDITNMGRFVRNIEGKTPVYVIANGIGDPVRGTPISAMPIMFLTDTFTPNKQEARQIRYISERDIAQLPDSGPMTILPMNLNQSLLKILGEKFPKGEWEIPGDFSVLTIK